MAAAIRVCLAIGIRSVQREQVQRARGGGLYSQSGRTPPKIQLPRGILNDFTQTRNRVRRAVYLGLKAYMPPAMRACGLCLNLHPQLALWASGMIASFAGLAVCRIVETPDPQLALWARRMSPASLACSLQKSCGQSNSYQPEISPI